MPSRGGRKNRNKNNNEPSRGPMHAHVRGPGGCDTPEINGSHDCPNARSCLSPALPVTNKDPGTKRLNA